MYWRRGEIPPRVDEAVVEWRPVSRRAWCLRLPGGLGHVRYPDRFGRYGLWLVTFDRAEDAELWRDQMAGRVAR